jgi:hypothetical protein
VGDPALPRIPPIRGRDTPNVQRHRNARADQRQTPFKERYLLTWIHQNKPREEATEEAIQRTDKVLGKRSSTNPIIEKVHSIRDMIIESSKLRNLVSFVYLQNELGCSKYELEQAIKRSIQLYPDFARARTPNPSELYDSPEGL